MLKYILKRIGLAIVILLGVSLIIYFLIRLMPVDFIQNKIDAMNQGGTAVPEETVENLYKMYGLEDDSLLGILKGYFNWLLQLLQGNLGTTFKNGIPVAEVIKKHMGVSFAISLIATVFEIKIAIPLGITAATQQYSLRDYIVTILVMIGISLPSFFFGNMLKDLFAYKLGWFPSQGDISATTSSTGLALLPEYFMHLFLPILTIIILSIGGRMRMTRTNMLEVLSSDYIRTARAKGLSETKVIYKHAFRNTLIPVVTSLAGLLPSLFSGSIITEQIFGIQGIGNVALDYMNKGDIPFIMGYNMFLAVLSVIGVLLADLMYVLVDPRVKIE